MGWRSITGIEIVDEGVGNVISIDPDIRFTRSRIYIKGNNNKIQLRGAKTVDNLTVNFKGDEKLLSIGETSKNINNLKFTSIRGMNQKLIIGHNFSCGGMELQMNDGDENCFIGNDCLFSWGIKIRTSDGHSIIDLDTGLPVNFPKDVVVGDHVWVGEDVKFLKGSEVPKNCVVGSCSVVTRKILDENSIIAGVPASVVKKNISWDRRMPSELIKDR